MRSLVSKQDIDNTISKVVSQYPGGLSRGLDHEIKQAAFTEIENLFGAIRCKELALGGMTIEASGHILDHYTSFFDNSFVYYYSQPYGSCVDNLEQDLPCGWELYYFNPTSWYFPGRCYTVIYRKVIANYKIYSSKVGDVITLWEGTKFNSHDKRDRRIIERKLDYYFNVLG